MKELKERYEQDFQRLESSMEEQEAERRELQEAIYAKDDLIRHLNQNRDAGSRRNSGAFSLMSNDRQPLEAALKNEKTIESLTAALEESKSKSIATFCL